MHPAHRPYALGLALMMMIASAAPATAQDTPLGALLLRFFSEDNPVVLQESQPFNHSAHFVSQPAAQGILTQLNKGIATQIATFPVSSSSASFSYAFDPDLGIFERNTESFGPLFAERPLTAGKGKFSFGVNFLRSTYDEFEGLDLRAGDIKLYLTHIDTNRDGTNLNPWFEGDIIEAALSIDLTNETTVFFANYGITDRLDFSVAVPVIRVEMNAAITTTIERLATGADPFIIHAFDDGSVSNVFTESGSASGLGDIVLRAKYNAVRRLGFKLAAAVDVRLPTGDEDELLGSGATQTKVFLIFGGAAGRLSPRANLGYTFSNGGSELTGDLPDEISYGAGFDIVLHPRVTLTADLVGRTQRDADRTVLEDVTFLSSLRTAPATRNETVRPTPASRTGDLNLALGAVGLKINLFSRILLAADVLFPLNSNGLSDKITPVVGIDYSF